MFYFYMKITKRLHATNKTFFFSFVSDIDFYEVYAFSSKNKTKENAPT